MKPINHYLKNPFLSFKLLIKYLIIKSYKNAIPNSLIDELSYINQCIEPYRIEDHFDFNGIILTTNGFNPDLFFNVVYPHIKEISYTKSDIKTLFKNAKSIWKSAHFFSDNFVYAVNFKGIVAHGTTYFYDKCLVTKDDIVFDLGASPGDFAALAICHGAKKVFCFDPIKSTPLFETAKLHGEKIEIIQKYTTDQNRSPEYITLDLFFVEKGLTKVDFIKMDIEGSEYSALLGSKVLIKKFRPKLAICLYHDLTHSNKLRRLLKEIEPTYSLKIYGPMLYCTPNQ
jgi:hypothetical protein